MKQPTITEISHLLINSYLNKEMIAVDMTCGNGLDTLFMAQKAKKVYGFDIQQKAIDNTRELTKEYDNVVLIKDSHENVLDHIQEKLDLAIFNFGYLPKGDKTIMTTPDTSLKAVKNVLSLLKESGWLILCFYPHPLGQKEKEVILDYLNPNDYLISCYKTEISNSPSLYLVTKRK